MLSYIITLHSALPRPVWSDVWGSGKNHIHKVDGITGKKFCDPATLYEETAEMPDHRIISYEESDELIFESLKIIRGF